jgi:hypothetical protein
MDDAGSHHEQPVSDRSIEGSAMSQDQLFLSTEERRRRREAVDYATASVELSGFKSTHGRRSVRALYVEGQLALKEFLEN